MTASRASNILGRQSRPGRQLLSTRRFKPHWRVMAHHHSSQTSGPLRPSQALPLPSHPPPSRTYHEDIARLWRVSALSKDLQHVPELSVNVTADRYWALDEVDIALFEKEVGDASTQCLYLAFGQVLALPDLESAQIRWAFGLPAGGEKGEVGGGCEKGAGGSVRREMDATRGVQGLSAGDTSYHSSTNLDALPNAQPAPPTYHPHAHSASSPFNPHVLIPAHLQGAWVVRR